MKGLAREVYEKFFEMHQSHASHFYMLAERIDCDECVELLALIAKALQERE